MKPSLRASLSRRRPRLFLGCRAPPGARGPASGAESAPRARYWSAPRASLSLRPPGLAPPRRSADWVRSRSRATWGMVFPPSSTSLTAPALNSPVKLLRGRRGLLSSAMLDTVPTSRKVSTRSDQAQPRPPWLSGCAAISPAIPMSGRRGSNPRPSAWEADALPLSYSRKCSQRLSYHGPEGPTTGFWGPISPFRSQARGASPWSRRPPARATGARARRPLAWSPSCVRRTARRRGAGDRARPIFWN